ncbi:hypothetical protein [Humibacter sp.]|jgi:hypothetical protein|uniref:hypothetical protein n=1 Tax=Humibacter sp. TaxID=1940291 RepID=UPI002B9D96E7|nr:hypothetical protein [Humibacter sp.]HVX08041.1 hypothetical protein [Humibacter sp.]
MKIVAFGYRASHRRTGRAGRPRSDGVGIIVGSGHDAFRGEDGGGASTAAT